jgi:hypothetical protein
MDGSTVAVMRTETKKARKGVTGSTLKLIAIITMLIDHTAATILDRTLISRGMGKLNSNPQTVMDFMSDNAAIYGVDMIMRLIGRIAFPIFCFLLVEGFVHTHNKWKYAMRLGIFALVSEIPFDLAFRSKLLDFSSQNVFFTLLIGLLVMMGFEIIREKLGEKKWLPVIAIGGSIAVGYSVTYLLNRIIQTINIYLGAAQTGMRFNLSNVVILIIGVVSCILSLLIYGLMIRKVSLQKASIRFADLLVLFVGMLLAQFLKTDYSAFGVLTIAVVCGLRKSSFKAILGGCVTLTIMNLSEITAFFALIPAALYNGKRGLNLKYVFYIFYPAHLLILYLICCFMGIV